MTEKDIAKRIVDILRDNNVRKDVRAIRTVFHISDDDGNTKDFVAKKTRTDVLFDKKDVSYILNAFILVVTEAVLRGEEVRLFNFGTFKLKQKAATKGRHPDTKEIFEVAPYYYPTFTYAKRIKNAAKLYNGPEDGLNGIDPDLINDIYNAIDNGLELEPIDEEEF